jgi:hypothetical protein
LDYILTLSLKEISALLNAIFTRKISERTFQANIHGVQLKKPSGGEQEAKPLTKEQRMAFKKALDARRNQNGK